MSLWSWVSVKGQGHSLTLVKGHSDFKVKTCFSQKRAIWNQSSYESLRENGNKKIYTNELGHMTNMATMPIYGKNLKKLLLQKQ